MGYSDIREEEDRGRTPSLLIPELGEEGVFHFFGTRLLGTKRAVQETYGIEEGRILTVRQVHREGVFVVGKSEGGSEGYDALAADCPHLLLVVSTADCLPLLFFDPRRRVIAAVHAGWRGSLRGVARQTVTTVMREFACHPGDLIVGLGPSIGPCCYEVGGEVLSPLRETCPYWGKLVVPGSNGKGRLDLKEWNRRQLRDMGIQNIFSLDFCTACRPDLFASYRRGGPGTSSMLSGIMLT